MLRTRKLPLKVSPGITDDQWLKLKTVFDVPDKARSFIDEIIALYRDYKDEHKGLTSAELTSQLLHVENQVRELFIGLSIVTQPMPWMRWRRLAPAIRRKRR
jgi:hypothetical protein